MLDLDNSELIDGDICAFVASKVQELSDQLGTLSSDSRVQFQSNMKAELLRRAEGTFLCISFAIMELLQKQTITQMEDVLCELPKGLPALYG
jgi:hypothetical protein